MRVAGEISLRPLAAGSDDEPRSEVVIESRPTGSIISGCVLEAAVHCAAGWLLFVTSNTPDEEILTIHLLDRDGGRSIRRTSAGPIPPARFRTCGSIRRPRCTFGSSTMPTVRAGPAEAEAGLTLVARRGGVWRGSRLTRHFEVRRQP